MLSTSNEECSLTGHSSLHHQEKLLQVSPGRTDVNISKRRQHEILLFKVYLYHDQKWQRSSNSNFKVGCDIYTLINMQSCVFCVDFSIPKHYCNENYIQNCLVTRNRHSVQLFNNKQV